jgi:hypothetical protein
MVELVSLFLRAKLIELRSAFGSEIREYQAVARQYVIDCRETLRFAGERRRRSR